MDSDIKDYLKNESIVKLVSLALLMTPVEKFTRTYEQGKPAIQLANDRVTIQVIYTFSKDDILVLYVRVIDPLLGKEILTFNSEMLYYYQLLEHLEHKITSFLNLEIIAGGAGAAARIHNTVYEGILDFL